MATFDYLKEQLNELVKQFKNAKASYEYDELANLHTIEILPQAVFDSEEFTDWECDFFKRAYKAIPGEDISFISEDAYFGIETVGWSVQGEDYLLSESLTMQTICVEMDNHFAILRILVLLIYQMISLVTIIHKLHSYGKYRR